MDWISEAASWVGSGLTILSGVSILLGGVFAGTKIWDGIKCILRSEMLHIYYQYKDTGKIRQYEINKESHIFTAASVPHDGVGLRTFLYGKFLTAEPKTQKCNEKGNGF